MALPILRRGGTPLSVRRSDGTIPTNTVSRVDPWNDFEVMNRLFDNFFTSPLSLFGRGLTQAAPSAEPGFALYETADDLIAYVALPGMARDKFDISASADSITIKAEQAPLLESPEGLISHTPWSNWAIATGSFSTSYNLPVEIDPAKVQAEYKDGVLQVRMPKSEAAKPRQVKVEIANS